ncbi:trypsin-like peptidase domain-containing protein [Streptomyces sp. NPDC056628]|uniref:trypsin-like peptidase domain-containing protein n=1 Tax=Streptomyces sp. NPDC056628 TaxID=3345882 RepID=UPI0036867FC4
MAGRGPRAADTDGTRGTGADGAERPDMATASHRARRARPHDDGRPRHARRRPAPERPDGDTSGPRLRDDALVRVHDAAGRPRGLGFLADHHGTVVTAHEVVDGLSRLVVHTAGGSRSCVVTAAAVTPLPERGLALVRTEGLGVDPLPVTVRDHCGTGTYVHIPAAGWRQARVLDATPATYTATDRYQALDSVLELAIGTAGRDALRLGGGAAGGPVLDAATGTVLGVLGTALQSAHSDAVLAAPLRPAPDGPLAALLADNAATVPAHGADLNLAGVLELTATQVAQDAPPSGAGPQAAPVQRAAVTAEFDAFLASPAAVLGLVGPPGSGRTTELAGLAARRAHGPDPAPTLWLRGADLASGDTSVADAARRALDRAARIVAASADADLAADLTPERLARLARAAGRPLLLLLDGPEEMPPAAADRLADWTGATARWLRDHGARLVVASRTEYWETAGAGFPEDLLHAPAGHPPRGPVPPCLALGDLTPQEARQARARHGIPDDALADADARHPLTLRLLADVSAALPGAPAPHRADRHDVLSAHLDLMCLRVAVRLAAENGLRGTAVRRLAARVAGQVHEAARRSLGTGRGELDRPAFEAVFPWGPAPLWLGGTTGWARAVLTEGLLVPAGDGYRFAHEELADWLQGLHLDLDEALRALLRPGPTGITDPTAAPLPHHRIGPVVQALLHLPRLHGTGRLGDRLARLSDALDADRTDWWAARLLTETLLRVPDATPHLDVLRLTADRIVAWRRQGHPAPADLGPAFWTALPLPDTERLDLLRRLVPADGPLDDAEGPRPPRYLDAVARLLAADPTAVQPRLTRWFDDDRPLPATPHATVALAAQALLHTHRHRALDDLTETLVASAHPRADELLGALAEEEPSALCRAVDRWAHDERPARRVAALAHGLRAAPHVRTEADRALLRYAALALLARPADSALHGGALALLVRDPCTRARHLPQALAHFAAADPQFPPSALVAALATHPEPVLEAFRARLERPGTGAVLRSLADVTAPSLARKVAGLVRDAVRRHPETATDVAAYVDRCLDHGPGARAVLFPLVTGLLDGGPEQVRAALATVLAAPGTPASRALRRELLDFLLTHEQAPAVLDALLHAAVRTTGGAADDALRDLVHHTGLLLVRTPDGAARFDRGLVDLAREVPGFAARVAGWLAGTPRDWAAVVGPSTRRMIENLAGVRVPV